MKTDKPEAIPATCQREAICTTCGKPVPAGAKCLWIAGEGVIHSECEEGPNPEASRTPTKQDKPLQAENPKAHPAFCQTETPCQACKAPILVDAECFWIERIGLVHPECLETLETEKSA